MREGTDTTRRGQSWWVLGGEEITLEAAKGLLVRLKFLTMKVVTMN